jgi:ABC-type Na+ efflux pump permease subunit
MLAREVKLLLRKELRQLMRNRAALLTALFLPMVLILAVPLAQILGMSALQDKQLPASTGAAIPADVLAAGRDPRVILQLLLAPLLAMGAMLTPALTANYIFIAERENRTLELLVALPVRVGQILLAKLLAVLILAAPVCLGLFAVDAGFMLARGTGTVGYVLTLLVMLLGALAFSTSSALLVSLLARDIRTSSNISGMLLTPFIFASFGVVMVVPGAILSAAVLAAVFFLGAAGTFLFAMRVVTFERMLR